MSRAPWRTADWRANRKVEQIETHAGEIGEGSVHRLACAIQRRFFEPPQEIGERRRPTGGEICLLLAGVPTTRVWPSASLKTAGCPALPLQIG